jgi:PTH1 family peptidyl-tRNA hydrolase
MRLRAQGSAGGHNGIRSIIAAVHSQDFPRIRIGVGSPESGVDQVGYVLGTPDSNEKESIDHAISKAVTSVGVILNEGIDIAMNKFN